MEISHRYQFGLLPWAFGWRSSCSMVGLLYFSETELFPINASRSSYLVTLIFMFITAAVLAEICSALPLSGSIYIWAAESAGRKYGRFFGFVVAWWACTAWMTFCASNSQVRRPDEQSDSLLIRCRQPLITWFQFSRFITLIFLEG